MKTIIAAAASLAFATSAFAVPSAPTEKNTVLKTGQMIELAWGPNRNPGVSTNRNGNGPGGNGAPTNGKTYTG